MDNLDAMNGSHVSGIVAGKNGVGLDGSTTFSGVVPEAQIICMKIFKGELAEEATTIDAIDDAVKMGVCAINMSIGSAYATTDNDSPYAKAIQSARDAGILVACAAGNERWGYNLTAPLTKSIEYSTSGIPSQYRAATSVAGSVNTIFCM